MDDYATLLASEMRKLHEKHPQRFRRYMVSGDGHMVLTFMASVARTADGSGPIDWLEAMVREDESIWKDVTASVPEF